jgi:hypothetical protein
VDDFLFFARTSIFCTDHDFATGAGWASRIHHEAPNQLIIRMPVNSNMGPPLCGAMKNPPEGGWVHQNAQVTEAWKFRGSLGVRLYSFPLEAPQ